jgi:hypothetical protein
LGNLDKLTDIADPPFGTNCNLAIAQLDQIFRLEKMPFVIFSTINLYDLIVITEYANRTLKFLGEYFEQLIE